MITLRIIAMFLVLGAFLGICWWAFSPKRRDRFKEASELPFDDIESTPESKRPNVKGNDE